MTISETVLIVVTLLGPILAVQAQKWIERAKARTDAKRRIFYALMGTRATRVAPEHVQALNMIDLEFSGGRWSRQNGREREVVKRWREYADHLNTDVDDENEAKMTAWMVRGEDLFINLLEAIAQAVGYKFDKVELRKGIYYPRAHDEAERGKLLLERALFGVLSGQNSLAMRVTEFPPVEAPSDDDPSPKRAGGKRQRDAHN